GGRRGGGRRGAGAGGRGGGGSRGCRVRRAAAVLRWPVVGDGRGRPAVRVRAVGALARAGRGGGPGGAVRGGVGRGRAVGQAVRAGRRGAVRVAGARAGRLAAAHAAGVRGGEAGGAGVVEPADRRAAGDLQAHLGQPRRAHPGQARVLLAGADRGVGGRAGVAAEQRGDCASSLLAGALASLWRGGSDSVSWIGGCPADVSTTPFICGRPGVGGCPSCRRAAVVATASGRRVSCRLSGVTLDTSQCGPKALVLAAVEVPMWIPMGVRVSGCVVRR